MKFQVLATFVAGVLLINTGCGGNFDTYPISYAKSKAVTDITDTVKQESVLRGLSELFGPSPREIKVPEGLALRNGGAYLANFVANENGEQKPLAVVDQTGEKKQISGGYSLYRKHCLHCHGVTGDGAGPTADYLYPRPRDYRKGLYKFTSTTAGAKPTRDDLWRTINYGLHGTSMPGFEALMTQSEIQQIIDYVIFLSIRGETEILAAQDVADGAWDEEIKADQGQNFALNQWQKVPANSKVYGKALETSKMVSDKWAAADSAVMNTPKARPASTNESILRGRELFLGKTTERLECWGCHGLQAAGNGKSFVDKKIFENVMFTKHVYQAVNTDDERALAILEATAKRFKQLNDERTSRLAAAGFGHGHSSHGDHQPLAGWVASLTMKSVPGVSSEMLSEAASHDFPGLKVNVKFDEKAEQPSLTIQPTGHHVRPQLVEDLTPGIRQTLLSKASGADDGKGWVMTYNGFVEIPADADEGKKLLAKARATLLSESVRTQLTEEFPGAQVNVVLSETAPAAEVEVAPVDEAKAGSTAPVTALVLNSVNQVKNYYGKIQTDWAGSMDDWQWPLRPANLNTGTYKGGRRPIDLYWRIAKGINGAKMPAHETTLKPDQIWDLVNFVLAVPNRPELLRDATEPVRNDAPKPPQVANN